MASVFSNKGILRVFLLAGGLFFTTTNTNAQTGKPATDPAVTMPDTSRPNLLMPVMMKDTGKNGNFESFTIKQCIDY